MQPAVPGDAALNHPATFVLSEATPHGDMMLAGCFGLLRAVAALDSEFAPAIAGVLGEAKQAAIAKAFSHQECVLSTREGGFMGRYLRLLAIAVVIIEVCTPLLTALLTISPPIWFVSVAGVGFLVLQALIITDTLLTIVMSTLALVSAFQHNQRPWFLSFLALALLSVYSPLLFIWLRISRTPFSDFYSLPTHRAAYYLIQLIPDIFPVFLAVVVFIYSLRYGRNESQYSGFSGADRAQLD